MNQIYYEPHDRLKAGDITRVLGLRTWYETKKALEKKGLDSKSAYGRSFTIKYSELVKVGLIHESDS
jgi:hypothetical protein